MPDPSHVLVVDDHPQMVALIRRWLVRAGYHVTGVTTVQEAFAALTEHDFAWVVSDLMLPTGDGMDILAAARTRHPQANIIIMTAFGSEGTRQQALTCGAHAFLSKPFSGEALLALLSRDATAEPSSSAAQGDQHQP